MQIIRKLNKYETIVKIDSYFFVLKRILKNEYNLLKSFEDVEGVAKLHDTLKIGKLNYMLLDSYPNYTPLNECTKVDESIALSIFRKLLKIVKVIKITSLTDEQIIVSDEDVLIRSFERSFETGLYSAPELHLNYDSNETIVWSLGVILYKMLYGSLPFASKDQIINREYTIPISFVSPKTVDLLNTIFTSNPSLNDVLELVRPPFEELQIVPSGTSGSGTSSSGTSSSGLINFILDPQTTSYNQNGLKIIKHDEPLILTMDDLNRLHQIYLRNHR